MVYEIPIDPVFAILAPFLFATLFLFFALFPSVAHPFLRRSVYKITPHSIATGGCETGTNCSDDKRLRREAIARTANPYSLHGGSPFIRDTLNCAPANKISPEVYAQNSNPTETKKGPYNALRSRCGSTAT
jgi:hypothetical protein